MHQNKPKEFNLKELLGGQDEYFIPIYQRNYAWESKEIEQLIQDIIDYSIHHPNNNYYIGTLVVAEERKGNSTYFNTIDGQQRLTTLSILSAVIKNEYSNSNPNIDLSWFNKLNLGYASREKSTATMKAVFDGKFEDNIEYKENIKSAYYICSKELSKKIAEYKITLQQFCDYLYKYVKILRVILPNGTDLNHYFEIMNSRGEQLEKHEILKAILMKSFEHFEEKKRDSYFAHFNLIWEACSNMEKYVQYGFSTTQRHLIFGQNDWNNLSVYSFDEVVEKLSPTISSDNPTISLSISDIVEKKSIKIKLDENDDSPDKFNSVVNFQNFLLHVLRVQTANIEVALDDKRLVDIFEKAIPKGETERLEFVKIFIYNLLKCKFLFDKYIIKRAFLANKDEWSLKSLKWYSSGSTKNAVKYTNTFGAEENDSYDSDNRKVLMLLSMFHVTISSMSYKYWLNAALYHLFNQFDVNSKDYILYLEHVAKSFVFDKFLAKNPKDYHELIYQNLSPIKRQYTMLDFDKLQYGKIENNLIFNFLDYLLWIKYKDIESDKRVKSFEYSFRSSVEHYYPQTPINGEIERLEHEYLHSFGNLCLISHEKNSRYSNYPPKAKKTQYGPSASIDSIKQYLMMKGKDDWSRSEIEEHYNHMLGLLSKNLDSEYIANTEINTAQKWFKEYQIKNKTLLIRALMCFGDCAKYESGHRYNFADFEYIRERGIYSEFETYINEKSPKDLQELINDRLELQNIKEDYQYLFIKYPKLIDYCKDGSFIWINEGATIYALKHCRNTTNQSREAYTYILALHLKDKFKINPYINNNGIYINVNYENNHFHLVSDEEECDFQIVISNNEGISINAYIKTLVNGNSTSIKLLQTYDWIKNASGNFEKNGEPVLIKLGKNYEENVSNLLKKLTKYLKNDLVIQHYE